jgi:phage shock protein E
MFASAAFAVETAFGLEMILPARLHQLQLQKSSFTLVDARPISDFQKHHINGAINVPKTAVSGVALPMGLPIIVYCGDARCPLSHEAAKTLVAAGYKDVKVLYGGIAEWRRMGYPMVPVDADSTGAGNVQGLSLTEIPSTELWGRLQKHDPVMVIDLRPEQEYAAGHLPGATNVPLEQLTNQTITKETEVIIYDRLPLRSQKGEKLLSDMGLAVHTLSGGIASWTMAGYPLETGSVRSIK